MTSKAQAQRQKRNAAKFKIAMGIPDMVKAAIVAVVSAPANDYTDGVEDALSLATRRERRAGHEVVRDTGGSVKILDRDGLLWLASKKKLTTAQLMAAEQYRKEWKAVHVQGLRSCLNDAHGGSMSFVAEAYVGAIMDLDTARLKGLNGDPNLIRLMDEVAGKGETLRDLAMGDDRAADRLLAKFEVACDLLAVHYGLASKKQA